MVRFRLHTRPLDRVTPLSVRLKYILVPVHAKPRRYPPQKREFLRRCTTELKRMDFIKPAVTGDWVAAPLIVPKTLPVMFRLTVDYRPIDSATQKIVWPMPHLDAMLFNMRSAEFFASIDLCSRYWQLPLAEDSPSSCAFMTNDSVVRPMPTS